MPTTLPIRRMPPTPIFDEPPAPHRSCPHLGEPVGTVKVDCLTCGGIAPLDFVACRCSAFPNGRCLPGFLPPDLKAWEERHESKIYRPCSLCPLRPNAG